MLFDICFYFYKYQHKTLLAFKKASKVLCKELVCKKSKIYNV